MSSTITPAATLHATQGRLPLGAKTPLPPPSQEQVEGARETQAAFTKFVGATVFGQMLGSMRKTVGEPAYFHGGQAEKVFQGQLDQAIADELTASSGSGFAQSLFENQFPNLADVLRRDAEAQKADHADEPTPLRREQQPSVSLNDLAGLRRR